MVSEKRKNTIFAAAILVLVAVVLFKDQIFLASTILFCENTEPTSLQEFATVIPTNYDGSFGAISSDEFKADSSLGVFFVKDPGFDCNAYLLQLESQSEATFVVLEKKQVLISGTDFIWCNFENNLAIRADSSTTLSNYVVAFESCFEESQEEPKVPIIDATECIESNGDFNDGLCTCEEKLLFEGQTCEVTAGTAASTTTTSATTEPAKGAEEEIIQTKPSLAAFGLLLVVFGIYWFFERGPKKGLVRKRGRKWIIKI